MSVLLVVGIGAFLTSADGRSYVQGPTAKFVIYNLSMVLPAFYLTGVHCGEQLCNINGSLWTIPWEVRCYLFLGLLGLVGMSRPAIMNRLILPATAAFAFAMHVPGVEEMIERTLGGTIAYYLRGADRLWFMFALGIAVFIWREKIRLSWWWTLGLLVLVVLSTRLGIRIPHLVQFLTASFVLNLGFLTAQRKVVSGNWPDYSYGMYIYAFPVMMVWAGVAPNLTVGALAAVTASTTLIPAALSWHLVEKPVLNRVRGHRRTEKALAPTPPAVDDKAPEALP